MAVTPGSNPALRREPDALAATSPSDYADPSFSSLDRLVQASVGSSALPLRDTRDTFGSYSQSQLSPQEYYEVGSDAAAAHGNPAALRWFDLLANDAGKDGLPAAPSQFDVEPGRGFLQGRDGNEATPLQRATRIVDDDAHPGNAQGPYNRLPDDSDAALPKRILERRLWQAEEDIGLMPREHILFDMFVHRISSTVCHSKT